MNREYFLEKGSYKLRHERVVRLQLAENGDKGIPDGAMKQQIFKEHKEPDTVFTAGVYRKHGGESGEK